MSLEFAFSASSPACCHLIPILVSGEVFGMQTEVSITLFDKKHKEETLQLLREETQNLVAPLLQSIEICTRVEDAFHEAHVVILLDDSTERELTTLEDYLRSKLLLCRLYGYLLEKNAHDSVKVLVGGKTYVNLRAVLLMRYAPSIVQNIIAVALGVEGQAKALLASKLKTTASSKSRFVSGFV